MKIDAQSPNGNGLEIMGGFQQLLKDADRENEIENVMKRMMSGNYDNLCNVAEEVTHGSIKVVNRLTS